MQMQRGGRRAAGNLEGWEAVVDGDQRKTISRGDKSFQGSNISSHLVFIFRTVRLFSLPYFIIIIKIEFKLYLLFKKSSTSNLLIV